MAQSLSSKYKETIEAKFSNFFKAFLFFSDIKIEVNENQKKKQEKPVPKSHKETSKYFSPLQGHQCKNEHRS